MSLTQLDTENADRDLTSLVTVLTDTPGVSVPMHCQVYVKLGDGVKDLDGTGGSFEVVITVGGQTVQPSPWTETFSTAVRASFWSGVFPVPANEEVVVRALSPNAADTDVDVTAYLYDTHDARLNQLANVGGFLHRAPTSYTLTTGTQSANTVSSTEELDEIRHEHTDVGNAMDLYYEFSIGSGLATEVLVTGYLQGNNDDLEVYGYDWVSVGWKRIGTMNGQATASDTVSAYKLLANMVGSGANEGTVRVRFTDGAFTLTTATLAIDQILVAFTQGVQGYEGGAVWLDTNASNTNTVRGVDGIASNPVSTIAAVNTLLASTNLARVRVAPQSSVTFAAPQANQQFVGTNWTLALGGQSITGSYIAGANVTGIGTGGSEIHFHHCHFGAVTLPPCDCEDCVLESTFTAGTAGEFFFENCRSGVSGTSTPSFDYGAALNASDANFRAYSGGIEILNMGAGTGSYDMSLEGHGQLIINANCSATSMIAIRGHFVITDNASGAVTLSRLANYVENELVDAVWDEVLTGGTHNVTNSAGKKLRQLAEQIGYAGGAIWIDTVNGVAGIVVGENGTVNNPVDSIGDALNLAAAIGITRMRVASGSSITLAVAVEGYELYNSNWTLALGGQSISGSSIVGADVSGVCTGANKPKFHSCNFTNVTLPPSHLLFCGFGGTLTVGTAGEFTFCNCHSHIAGTSAPVFDFGAALNSSGFNFRHYSGGVEVQNMGAGTGSYNMSLEGFGQLIINANCSATSTIAIRGHFTITDNAGGAVTLSDDARLDVDAIADAVADELLAGHTTSDSLGAALRDLHDRFVGKHVYNHPGNYDTFYRDDGSTVLMIRKQTESVSGGGEHESTWDEHTP